MLSRCLFVRQIYILCASSEARSSRDFYGTQIVKIIARARTRTRNSIVGTMFETLLDNNWYGAIFPVQVWRWRLAPGVDDGTGLYQLV